MSFSSLIDGAREFLIWFSVTTLGVVGINIAPTPQPLPSPVVEVLPSPTVLTPELSEEATRSASPSPIASVSAKSSTSSPRPTPMPTITNDLNFEGVSIIPNYPKNSSLNKFGDPLDGPKDNQNFWVKEGNSFEFMFFFIRNNGHEDAKNVELKIIADGETLSSFDIDVIEKQSRKQIRREDIKLPLGLGKHTLEIQLNPEKKYPEAKFDNNTKLIEYEVIN